MRVVRRGLALVTWCRFFRAKDSLRRIQKKRSFSSGLRRVACEVPRPRYQPAKINDGERRALRPRRTLLPGRSARPCIPRQMPSLIDYDLSGLNARRFVARAWCVKPQKSDEHAIGQGTAISRLSLLPARRSDWFLLWFTPRIAWMIPIYSARLCRWNEEVQLWPSLILELARCYNFAKKNYIV